MRLQITQRDTKLHVYTQAVDGSLVAMASNDDGCGTGFLSSATFNILQV